MSNMDQPVQSLFAIVGVSDKYAFDGDNLRATMTHPNCFMELYDQHSVDTKPAQFKLGKD